MSTPICQVCDYALDERGRCAACGWQDWHKAQSFKERIMLPPEIYQPIIDERLARWNCKN